METLSRQLDAFYEALLNRADPATAAIIGRSQQMLSQADYGRRARQLGEVAPAFELPDRSGETKSLTEFLRRGPILLTFFRGGWCPFCTMSLRAMALIRPQLRELGADLVAISPEAPSPAEAPRDGLTFPILFDHGNTIAKLYGVDYAIEPEMREVYARFGHHLPAVTGTQSWELPIPASFVLAPDGRIILRHVDPRMHCRIEPQTALAAVRELVEAAP